MIKLYSASCGYLAGNSGDAVSAPLIRALTGEAVQVMAEPENAELFGAGSILDKLPSNSTAAVWGSGLIHEAHRVDSPKARPLALRGKLTARRWAGFPDVPLGDPGLLVSTIWPAAPKRWRLGIVPHYADYDNEPVTRFARRWQEEVTVIDICGHVKDVCWLISSCDYILSSSLHGLIFAESYGVPNARLVLSDKVAGGSFKFRDYASALGMSEPVDVPFDGGETVPEMTARVEGEWHVQQRQVAFVQSDLITALTRRDIR